MISTNQIAEWRGAARFAWLRALSRVAEHVPAAYEFDARTGMRRLIADRSRHSKQDSPLQRTLHAAERSEFSQNGEDGVIEALLASVGTTNRWFIEIGASDGGENCTRRLASLGWEGVWVEADPDAAARAQTAGGAAVTVVAQPAYRHDVVDLLRSAGAPPAPDVLVVDIDSDDLGVLTACLGSFSPRIVVAEYNGAYGPGAAWSLPDRYGGWDGTFRHGASLRALADAAEPRGYRLVYCDSRGVNAFFVRDDAVKSLPGGSDDRRSTARRVADLYRAPAFTANPFGHPRSARALAPMPAITLEQVGRIEFAHLAINCTDVEPGDPVPFTFDITNRSGVRLTSGGPKAFHLSARWLDATETLPPDAARISLPISVPDAATRRFHMWLPAPEPGQHTLRVTGVSEQLTWCELVPGTHGFADASVTVR